MYADHVLGALECSLDSHSSLTIERSPFFHRFFFRLLINASAARRLHGVYRTTDGQMHQGLSPTIDQIVRLIECPWVCLCNL